MKKVFTILILISIMFCCSITHVYAEPSPPAQEQQQQDDSGGILDAITNIPNKIVEVFTEPLRKYYEYKIEATASHLEGTLEIFKEWVSEDDLSSTRFNFAKGLWSAMLPTAYVLLGLFFIIDFCKKVTYFEVMEITAITKILLKLVLCKILIQKSYLILSGIVSVTRQIVGIVFRVGHINAAKDVFKMKQLVDQKAISLNPISWVLEDLGLFLFIILIWMLLGLVFVMLNLRNIELAVLTGIAPLYFATFGGDATNDVFKSYIKNYVAVAAQTIWMAVGLVFLTSGYLDSRVNGGMFASGGFKLFIGVLTLAIYVIKAPASLKSAIGGSGSSEMNLSSLALLLS